MPVLVVDYDPSWPEQFEALRRTYADALRAAAVTYVAIEHVGSTSVEGLAAKPVIDCDIVVAEADVESASRVLEAIGFARQGEQGIPQRWAFRAPEGFPTTATYVVVEGSLALRNHLALREVLRNDARLRDAYGEVKKEVGATASDIFEYGRGKNGMVQRILAAAGLKPEELATIDGNQIPGPEVAPSPHLG